MTLYAKSMAGELIPVVVHRNPVWLTLHSKLSTILELVSPKMLQIFSLDDEKSIDDEEFMGTSVKLNDSDVFGYILTEPTVEFVGTGIVEYTTYQPKKPLYNCTFVVSISEEILMEFSFMYRIKDNKFYTEDDAEYDEPVNNRRKGYWYTPWGLTGKGHDSIEALITSQSQRLGNSMKQLILSKHKKLFCDFLQRISEKLKPGFEGEQQIALERLSEL